jgi:outer membrane protein TolC
LPGSGNATRWVWEREETFTVKQLSLILLSTSLAACLLADNTHAQPSNSISSPLTLGDAIQYGLDHYPSIRASVARVTAARSGVDLAQTAYLPRLDVGFQENRATFNNVSGLYFSNPFTQPISGPDLGRRSYTSAWGSAGGALAGWEPFDFGLRAANVRIAEAAEREAAAGAALTQLQVGLGVGDAFLGLIAAQETVKAMQADVERRRIFADTVSVLVKNGLRPGVEASRANAELAGARTQLIQAEQAEEIARASLAEILGVAGERIEIQPRPLLSLPASRSLGEVLLASHPQAKTQKATIDVFQSRKEALDRTWVPRLELQAAFFARGSGWDNRGNRGSGADGLGPDSPNYAAGLTVTFPLFDFAPVRARRATEQHNEEAERARYDQVLQELKSKDVKARATINGARRIADNTPVQLMAARDTETQARARYQAGLATVIDVADAQRLLVQASIDDALARLGVWRALLAGAGALGDLRPFLELVRASSEGGR